MIESILNYFSTLTKSEIIILAIVAVITIALIIVIFKILDKKGYVERTPKEKMYRAITFLVYIIIALIGIKILFWTGIISSIKN